MRYLALLAVAGFLALMVFALFRGGRGAVMVAFLAFVAAFVMIVCSLNLPGAIPSR